MDFKTLHLEGVAFIGSFLYADTVQAEKRFNAALKIPEYWVWEH